MYTARTTGGGCQIARSRSHDSSTTSPLSTSPRAESRPARAHGNRRWEHKVEETVGHVWEGSTRLYPPTPGTRRRLDPSYAFDPTRQGSRLCVCVFFCLLTVFAHCGLEAGEHLHDPHRHGPREAEGQDQAEVQEALQQGGQGVGEAGQGGAAGAT